MAPFITFGQVVILVVFVAVVAVLGVAFDAVRTFIVVTRERWHRHR